MEKSPNVQALLGACRNAAELRRLIGELCAGFGEVLHLTLLCGDHSPGQRMCVIDLVPKEADITLCAQSLGGQRFGCSSVVVNFTPHSEFGCVRGYSVIPSACSCTPRG